MVRSTKILRSALVLGVVPVMGSLLTACGGTTVDSSEVSGTSAAVTQLQTFIRPVDPAETQRRPVDDPAHEVTSLPERKPQLSAVDEQMLEKIKEEGIDVSGYEVQLAALGSRVCQMEGGTEAHSGDVDKAGEKVDEIVFAVAGQLVEQGKTKKSAKDTAAVLDDVMQKAYC